MVESFRRGFSQAVDPVRYGLLQQVAERGQMQPSELAAALDVVTFSVPRHVQALKEHDLVTIVSSPDDRRSSLVEISAARSGGWSSTGGFATVLSVYKPWDRTR